MPCTCTYLSACYSHRFGGCLGLWRVLATAAVRGGGEQQWRRQRWQQRRRRRRRRRRASAAAADTAASIGGCGCGLAALLRLLFWRWAGGGLGCFAGGGRHRGAAAAPATVATAAAAAAAAAAATAAVTAAALSRFIRGNLMVTCESVQGVQRIRNHLGISNDGAGGCSGSWAEGSRRSLQEQNQVIVRAGIGGDLLRVLSGKFIGILARARKTAAYISRAMPFHQSGIGCASNQGRSCQQLNHQNLNRE